MRRKDREINDKSVIEEIFKSNYICRIALSDNNLPYIISMNYGYHDKKIYLHTAREGRKLDIIKKNNNVCIEISDSIELIKDKIACRFDTKYRSIIATGKIYMVNSREEKIIGLKAIMYQHSKQWDWEFNPKDITRVMILRIDIESISAKKSNL